MESQDRRAERTPQETQLCGTFIAFATQSWKKMENYSLNGFMIFISIQLIDPSCA